MKCKQLLRDIVRLPTNRLRNLVSQVQQRRSAVKMWVGRCKVQDILHKNYA